MCIYPCFCVHQLYINLYSFGSFVSTFPHDFFFSQVDTVKKHKYLLYEEQLCIQQYYGILYLGSVYSTSIHFLQNVCVCACARGPSDPTTCVHEQGEADGARGRPPTPSVIQWQAATFLPLLHSCVYPSVNIDYGINIPHVDFQLTVDGILSRLLINVNVDADQRGRLQ